MEEWTDGKRMDGRMNGWMDVFMKYSGTWAPCGRAVVGKGPGRHHNLLNQRTAGRCRVAVAWSRDGWMEGRMVGGMGCGSACDYLLSE